MEEFNFIVAGGSDEAEGSGGDVSLCLLRNVWTDSKPGKCCERANISEACPRMWTCVCKRFDVWVGRCLVNDDP